MGSGTGTVTTGDTAAVLNGADPNKLPDNPLRATLASLPDASDMAVQAARRAAARRLSAKRGLQSTLLTTPELGDGGMLGGGT